MAKLSARDAAEVITSAQSEHLTRQRLAVLSNRTRCATKTVLCLVESAQLQTAKHERPAYTLSSLCISCICLFINIWSNLKVAHYCQSPLVLHQ